MVNYQEGKIYKIVCNVTGLVYIGSTCEPILARRLAGHRKHFNEYLKTKDNFMTSVKVLENGDYSIILLEKCPCNDRMELLKRERHYIETNECVNKLIPSRTKKEYREDNKSELKLKYLENREKHLERYQEYYKENKEILCEKRNSKYKCECGSEIRLTEKARHFKTKKHQTFISNQLPV